LDKAVQEIADDFDIDDPSAIAEQLEKEAQEKLTGTAGC
jgi:hypothetical protein